MQKIFRFVFFLALVLIMGGCATMNNTSDSSDTSGPVYKRDVADYEAVGIKWGKNFYNNKPRITPEIAAEELKKPVSLEYVWNLSNQDDLAYYWGQCNDVNGINWSRYLIKEGYLKDGNFVEVDTMLPISRFFITLLILNHHGLDFFGVHSDLKNAFKKGFREGYQDRTADLVLGPYLQKAAGITGDMTAIGFVSIINKFERGWKVTLEKAVNIFIELIADGSQAEREQFVKDFAMQYREKYMYNRGIINVSADSITSEGGTKLYLDPKRTQSTLDIPSDESLKNAIYQQTFLVMGDEMGRRYSHNLISHENLVDWLRRSKLALNMDHSTINNEEILKNLKTLGREFANSYGLDGDNVFNDLAKEAGYNDLKSRISYDNRPREKRGAYRSRRR